MQTEQAPPTVVSLKKVRHGGKKNNPQENLI